MNWVGSSPSTPTGFEMFLLEHFGMQIDLSSNLGMAVVGFGVLMLPFFFAGWSNARSK